MTPTPAPIPPSLPTTFFTAERLSEFWGYVRWFMKYNMPIFMICMAALVAWLVLDLVVQPAIDARRELDRDGRRSRRDDDDDDDD